MEERDYINDLETMLRLKYKSKLYFDVNTDVLTLAKYIDVYKRLGGYGKKIYKITLKERYKDYKRGLRKINKNIPLYIELPKLKKEGNGMYSQTSAVNTTAEKEITVNDVLLAGEKLGVLDYTEDNP